MKTMNERYENLPENMQELIDADMKTAFKNRVEVFEKIVQKKD